MTINIKVIYSLLGNVLLFLMIALSVPLLYSFITVSKGSAEFLATTIIVGVVGLVLKHFGKTRNLHMTIKDMFLFTSLVWLAILFFSALPFLFILKIDFISAFYETASAVSTTGSTILSDLDNLPPSILLWRSLLQFIGGIGFIAVGIAILPNLNVGGMKLFQTESNQQRADNVTPKSKTLAKGILYTYLGLTLLATIIYYNLGMTLFDAVNHAFTTVSTGGMSTHVKSIEYFNESIQWVTVFFMFIGALPFALLVMCFRGGIKSLCSDAQVRGFVFLIVLVTLIMAASLVIMNNIDVQDALKISFFNAINILSSTGYTYGDFTAFNHFITILFFFILPLGGCSGSTSGGLKIFRLQVALTLFKRQMKQLMHPNAIFPQRYNNHNVSDTIIRSLIAFFFAYLMVAFVSSLILAASGLDFMNAISLTITSLSNIGPAVSPDFGPCGDFSVLTGLQKIVLSIDMVLGRLEVLTMLICFMPSFWRV